MKKRLFLLLALTGIFLVICIFSGCYAGPGGNPATAAATETATYAWTNASGGDSGTLHFYSDDQWYKEGIVSGYRQNSKGTYTGNPGADGTLIITRSHVDTGHGWYEAYSAYSVTVSGGVFEENGSNWTRQ